MRCLLFPPGWVVLAATLLGYGGFFLLLVPRLHPAAEYAVYTLSAYALTVDIAALPRLKAYIKKRIVQVCEHSRILGKIRKTTFGGAYLNNRDFRVNTGLSLGMAVNFLYTVFRAVTGILYASPWFISMAVYYFLLGILRAYLVRCYRRRPKNPLAYEYRCYQTMGKLLLLLNIPMSGMVCLVIFENSGFVYPGLVIYLSAFYTFYMAMVSVINLWKTRKMESPVLAAAKFLNMVSAAMSLMGLQTAMIARFGGDGTGFRVKMNSITGIGVCALALGVALYMTIDARRKLRKVGGA